MTELNILLKHTSRSLYLSARLLPPSVRESFCIAYLLCRYADSIADTSLLAPQKRQRWISRFPSMVTHPDPQEQEQLKQEISGTSPNIYEEKLLQNLPACLNAFEQINDTEKKKILEVVHSVCEGMEIDLRVFPAENSGKVQAFFSVKELEHYCHLMGGAPGVFWSKLITEYTNVKLPEEVFCQYGQDIGDALQIVNILRDLPRDLRIGRCYFPQEDLAKQNLTATDLLHPENAAKFETIKQKWIAWGHQKLRSAFAFYAALPRTQLKHRAAVAWPVLWAADTLRKLSEERDLLNPARRVKITRYRIYTTMLLTPPLLISDTLFSSWLKHKLKALERTQKK